MSGNEQLPNWQNRRILAPLIRPFYRPDLPYHNFPHAIRTTQLALMIARQAIAKGADIDIEVLPLAGYAHDAGSWLVPGIDHDFDIPELYARDIALRTGRSLGMPKKKLLLAGDIIESTAKDRPCQTDTARALRRGDLMAGGLADRPVAFLNSTYRLYRESKMLKGQKVAQITKPLSLISDMVEYAAISREALDSLLGEDLRFQSIEEDKAGESFALRAAYNVTLLTPRAMADFLSGHLQDVVDYRPFSV